jgi:hypothetical protein
MSPWYDGYWPQWVIQNILPNPAWWLLVIVPGAVFRKRIKAWWHRHFGAEADLREIRETAAAAHKIMADLYRHHTGHAHKLAPDDHEGGT